VAPAGEYDLILVGTGFASAFFLVGYLKRASPKARVLVLERGARRPHSWQLNHRGRLRRDSQQTFANATPDKDWRLKVALGGGSICWWGCVPRMLPEDFELHSRYGVGRDWPLRYDDLEEHYCDVEERMGVSGPDDGSPFPRSRPYPQAAHGFSEPDRLLKAAHPDRFFHQPAARPTRATASRPACCGSGACTLCPIDAKFTILNEMLPLFEDPRVTLRTDAFVVEVETRGDVATGVRWLEKRRERTARAEVVALGANALFNPWLLLRSGLDHPATGRGLCEQRSLLVSVQLDGLNAFQGTTSITGHGYHLYAGAHRRERAAALIETWNVPYVQDVRGRWRQRLRLKVIFEDLPQPGNQVTVDPDDPNKPRVAYHGPSAYLERTRGMVKSLLRPFLEPLPVRRYRVFQLVGTESHILSTTPMGDDPEDSVVDRHLRHHHVRNLLVLGGGVFPSVAPANPTLTLSALSLWAARALFG
jgi:choline dehydrogenase-like flavoprotein